MERAIFLDRDGVLIENRPGYVLSWGDVSIFSYTFDALKRINSSNFMIIIVTNQSAVGRGLLSLDAAEEINRRLLDEISRGGGRIDAVMMCPHDPGAGCSCRKPLPGLFMEAAQKMSIDLENSFMIGDAASDLIAAKDAGVKQLILVQTGRGAEQRVEAESLGLQFKSCTTLWEAIDGILCG